MRPSSPGFGALILERKRRIKERGHGLSPAAASCCSWQFAAAPASAGPCRQVRSGSLIKQKRRCTDALLASSLAMPAPPITAVTLVWLVLRRLPACSRSNCLLSLLAFGCALQRRGSAQAPTAHRPGVRWLWRRRRAPAQPCRRALPCHPLPPRRALPPACEPGPEHGCKARTLGMASLAAVV